MRRTLFTLIAALFMAGQAYTAAGIFQDYVIANPNSTGDTYLAGGANADMASLFQGNDYGSLNSLLIGGEIKSFKNNETDVTSASLFYRVYETGTTAGVFTEISLPFDSDLGNGDQKWAQLPSVEVAAGLVPGDYTLEVYWRITTNGTDADPEIFESAFGSNYQATFTREGVTPVILTSFSAQQQNRSIDIVWTVESEVNHDHYEVYKSQDDQSWTLVDIVAGRFGRAESVRTYATADLDPFSGRNIYQLRQYDLDGTKNIIGKTEVNYQEGLIIPTLVTQELALPTDVVGVLYNLSGQQVWKNNRGRNTDVSHLSPGTYILVIQDNLKKHNSYRIIKQ